MGVKNLYNRKKNSKAFFLIAVIVASLFFGMLQYTRYTKERVTELNQNIAFYDSLIRSETKWLATTPLSNGALAFYPLKDGNVYLNPSFSEYTALALIRDNHDENITGIVRNYLFWHFEHLNTKEADTNGLYYTIYDYFAEVENGIVISESTERDYDSADAYAGGFLILLWEYYKQTGDAEFLIRHFTEISGITEMLLSLQQPNGLAYASPDYPVCYLMDNCEVYLAVNDALFLYQKLFIPYCRKNDADKLQIAESLAKDLEASRKALYFGIENTLWNKTEMHYEYSVQDLSSFGEFNWNELYPSASAQLAPCAYGVINTKSTRAVSLYEQFCAHHNWQAMESYMAGEASFYNGSIAYCAAIMRDYESLNQYLATYTRLTANGHPYPAYNADTGWVVLACKEARAAYQNEADRIDPLKLFH